MKIILICLYFGKLPDYFNYYLKSCAYNKKITWLIYTDDISNSYILPSNVIIKHIAFDEMQSRIQSKFDFKISLESPYKLCDFKPAYGYIFEDEIKPFDFWGHCDLDVIWGNLNKYLTDYLFGNYEKIFTSGHMTIYKNDVYVNRRFMYEYKWHNYMFSYKKIFSTPSNFIFDENNYIFDIHKIYDQLKIPYYKALYSDIADIDPRYSGFHVLTDDFISKHQVFKWENGSLFNIFIINNQIMQREFAYIHFLHRNMSVDTKQNINANSFLITPCSFLSFYNVLNIDNIKLYGNNENKFNHNYFTPEESNRLYKELINKLIK